MTLMVKTVLGYVFIQEIKAMNSTVGAPMPDEPVKEVFMAAVFPNPLFLVIGLISFGLVYGAREAFRSEEA
jgi:hypothetical protein